MDKEISRSRPTHGSWTARRTPNPGFDPTRCQLSKRQAGQSRLPSPRTLPGPAALFSTPFAPISRGFRRFFAGYSPHPKAAQSLAHAESNPLKSQGPLTVRKVRAAASELRVFREPIVRRLSAGGEWIRTFSSAMPRRQRGRLHSATSGLLEPPKTALLVLPRPTTAGMIAPRRQSIGPKLGRSLETATCLVRN
jgi:hypothetical protein